MNSVKTNKNTRQSNIELFRIIAMLLIVAHHYVVNSGLMNSGGPIYENLLAPQSLFLLVLGGGGKIGINCFVLITGYFMCKQNISLRKFLKLIFEILFYNIVITLIFFLAGYEPFSGKQFINGLLLVRNIGTGFTSAFIIFYLFIPFLNILIKNLNERKHLALIVLTICTYSIIATIPKFNVTFNYVSGFIVLYFISSFIRMYPKKLGFNKKIGGISSIVLIFICILSILLMTYISSRYDKFVVFRFVSDSNQFLALLTAICTFMAFKNLNIRNSKIINTIAASTFGVLLIHANSDIMRKGLGKDTLNNCDAYYLEGGALYYIQYCQ